MKRYLTLATLLCSVFLVSTFSLYCSPAPGDEASSEVVSEASQETPTGAESSTEKPATEESSNTEEPSTAPDESTPSDAAEPQGAEPAQDAGPEPSTEPTPDVPVEGPPTENTTPEKTGTTSTWTGGIRNFSSGRALDGVDVCVEQPKGTPCVTTNTKGEFQLPNVPDKQERIISFKKASYFPVHLTVGTEPARTQVSLGMLPSQTFGLLAAAVGKQLKPGMGHVVFQTFDDSLLTLSHTEGKLGVAGVDGPYYLNTAGQPDPRLTHTSGLGLMAFLNVPPGTQTFTLTSKLGLKCREYFAWPGSKANEFRTLVQADTLSYSYLRCRREIRVRGTVTDFTNSSRLAGVKVCLDLPSGTGVTCATTDAQGNFELTNVPESRRMMFSLEKTGYVKVLQPVALGQRSYLSLGMIPQAAVPLLVAATGNSALKPGTGIVLMSSFDHRSGTATGITMALQAAGAKGPYFISTSMVPDPKLQATTSAGVAFFIDVPPGEHVVTVTGLAQTQCSAYRAWTGSKPNEFVVSAVADAATYFSVSCARQATRKLGETCKQSDPSKPDYHDCVALHSCDQSGKCVAVADKHDACTTIQGCVPGSGCVGTGIAQASFCMQRCDPIRPDCPSGFQCINLNNNTGACFEECQQNTDCSAYSATACETPSSGAPFKICK
ncbi:MAG: hypothetical protein EP343_09645 [Deltaproteobacteria bacterium]|nr:MAG: hypothetical protein EP343_09645 [Deltaproteobacteria bacterium]